MELETPEPAAEPSRDEPALPIPVAAAVPSSADLLIERLDAHARVARGAFADNTVRAFAA